MSNLRQVEEGERLANFVQSKHIKQAFSWDDERPAHYDVAAKTLYCDRRLGREQVMGAMAREFRRAYVLNETPELLNATHPGYSKHDVATRAVLLRTVEADAMSYELSMRVELMKKNLMTEVAAPFAGYGTVHPALDRVSDKAKAELHDYAGMFIARHSADPFSDRARAETFMFLQSSRYFRETVDAAIVENLSHPKGRKTTRHAKLPALRDAFNNVSQTTLEAKVGKGYLHAGLIRNLDNKIIRGMSQKLRALIESHAHGAPDHKNSCKGLKKFRK